MHHNPYAPPQAPPPVASSFQRGTPEPWDVGQIVSVAFTSFGRDWLPLTAAIFLPWIMGLLITLPFGALHRYENLFNAMKGVPPVPQGMIEHAGTLVSFVLAIFFLEGQYRIFIASARGEVPRLSWLFQSGRRFVQMAVVYVALVISVTFGLLLLVVPGCIIATGSALSLYYCTEGAGIRESFRLSWESTRGSRLQIFLCFIIMVVFFVAGALLCCIGYFPAMAIASLMFAHIYVRASGTRIPAASATPYTPHTPPNPYPPT